MLVWLLQLQDLLTFGILHLFFLFGLFCWTVWIIRLATSRSYKPFSGETPQLNVSVLVPTFEEDVDDLKENVSTILTNIGAHDEVLVIFDERDKNRDSFNHTDNRLRMLSAPPGKRSAIRAGLLDAKNPIFLLTGSDTRFSSSTVREILKPFKDRTIGGVTGRVTVSDTSGIGAQCYKWALYLRNLIVYPGMSMGGTVHVLNGECYAARTEIAKSFIDEFTNQRFLGKKFDSGDDGWMTTLLLKSGFKTVYQSTAVTETDPPRKLSDFLKQQLRWHRNSTRRTLFAIRQPWAWKRNKVYPFHLVVTLIKTPLWILVAALAIWFLVIGGGQGIRSAAYLEPIWQDWRLFFFIVGIILVRAIRGLPYLIAEPKATLFLPIYAFLAPFILAPLRFYGMLTARNSKWITRGGHKNGINNKINSLFLFGMIAGLVVAALLFPFSAMAIILLADDDFDAY